MKIALIGATGYVGSAVLKEALDRSHEVTAIARETSKVNVKSENLQLNQIDVKDTDELAGSLKDHDVVISAFNSGWTNPNIYDDFMEGSRSIQEAVEKSGVKRYIVVGGAGSLYANESTQLVDTPEFPQAIKEGATAARDYLNLLKKEENLEWTFFSPAPGMFPGNSPERRGTYRIGLENPVLDEKNQSVISVEDAAVALVDEAENSQHIRRRFTAAY